MLYRCLYVSTIAVTLVFNATAGIYYVSMSGNDKNTGTGKDAPWQYCPGMPGWSGSGTVKAGDTVFFNNADTWEVASGDVVLQVAGGVMYDGKTWGAGKKAHFKATGDLNRSVISIMHDHATIPTVIRGFEADAGGHITTGIGINHPQMQNQLLGAVKRIEECDVHAVASFAPATYKYGIVISNWGGKYQVSNVEVLNCKVYAISRGGINLYPGNDSTTNWIKNILVRGNEVWNTGMDTSYGGSCLDVKNHVINSIVEYNYVHDPARGIGIGVSTNPVPGFIGPENAIIRYNIISGSKHAGMYIQDLGNKSLEIYGNIIMKSKYQGIILTDDLTDTLSIKIFNNIFYHNFENAQWSEEIRILCKDATIKTLELRNNLVYTYPLVRALLDDYGSMTAHSNNLYYNPTAGNLVIANGTTYTATTITGWESTALTGNPLLTDTSALPAGFTGTSGVDMRPFPEGLAITKNSPAKDNGMDLGAAYNGSINSIRRPFDPGWDIGAYEYSTAMGIRHPLQSKVISGILVKCVTNHIIVAYHAPLPIDATVSLFTVSGKMVTSVSQKLSKGLNVIKWKYSSEDENPIGNGCYIVCLKTTGVFFIQRIMLW